MRDRAKRPPGEALVDLRRRLSLLPPRDAGRTEIIARAAQAYGISIPTMYRALRELSRPKSIRRADHGRTRVAPQAEMERYAEIVAAMTADLGRELFRYPYRAVGAMPPFRFEVPSRSAADRAICERIITAWHVCAAADPGKTGGMWDQLTAGHTRLKTALAQRDPDLLADLLANMFQEHLVHGLVELGLTGVALEDRLADRLEPGVQSRGHGVPPKRRRITPTDRVGF